MSLDDSWRDHGEPHDDKVEAQTPARVSLNFERFAAPSCILEDEEGLAQDVALLRVCARPTGSETSESDDADTANNEPENSRSNDKSIEEPQDPAFSPSSLMNTTSLLSTARSEPVDHVASSSKQRHSTAESGAQWTRTNGPSLPWLSEDCQNLSTAKGKEKAHIDTIDEAYWARAASDRDARVERRRSETVDLDGEAYEYIEKKERDIRQEPETCQPKLESADKATQTIEVVIEDVAIPNSDPDPDHGSPSYDLAGRFEFLAGMDEELAIAGMTHHFNRCRPHGQWDAIRTLDLSHQNLTAVHGLGDVLRCLETLVISDNAICHISDLPQSLQVLKAKSNKLTDVDSFKGLPNLQYLDVCNNAIQSFKGVGSFLHLRTLHAENNKIASCGPFRHMKGLVVLNLRGNIIKQLRFKNTPPMDYLETLDVSYNRIGCLDSIEALTSLRVLNLDHNDIKWIRLDTPSEKLKVLRMSYNRLKSFNGNDFPDLRTLYLDDNQILRIIGLSCIPRLDSFSMREEGGQKVEMIMQYLRSTRKLYLSGNPLKHLNNMVDFFTLEYLELCSVQLEELPKDFSRQVPNLGTLYLSHNYLQDIKSLSGLRHLQKLVLIDNRLQEVRATLESLSPLTGLRYLDLRQNPITLKCYPPLSMSETYKYSTGCDTLSPYLALERDKTWLSRDTEFLQNLPEQHQKRRVTQRALIIKVCTKITVLDGIEVTDDERQSAESLVAQRYNKRTG